MSLAFIGDVVYELLVRKHILLSGEQAPGQMHHRSVKMVCASAQSLVYDRLPEVLDEEELAILKRGRNASPATIPKSASQSDYRRATAVEALFGYLYLSGNTARLEELFGFVLQLLQEQE